MQITRTKPQDAQTERYIIISMIMSSEVCREIRAVYKKEYFQSKLTKEIAKWCMDFYDQYEQAIKQDIEAHLEMKSKAGTIDPDLEDEIRKFLFSLSEEYENWETLNEKYYTDIAIKYFQKRSYLNLSEQLKNAVYENDLETANKNYLEFTKVQSALDNSRDILEEDSIEKLRLSTENRPPVLFEMPGDLGKLIGPIERATFIGILGGEKSGKTYHLMMFAIAAAKRGLNVAMIETGDLTQDQLDTRFYSYLTNKAAKYKHAGMRRIAVPDCIHNQTGECTEAKSDLVVVRFDEEKRQYVYTADIKDDEVIKTHIPCSVCKNLRRASDGFADPEDNREHFFKGSVWWEFKKIEMWNWSEAKNAVRKFKKRFKGKIITEAFPMQSIRASDVRNWILSKQKNDGWLPDIVLIDYPDIMLPEQNKEYRHQENEKWMILRQISQEFNCCVVATTQADSKSYGKDNLSLQNFSEDKRKYSHVTHFFAINKSRYESENGCSRFSALLLREDMIEIGKQVTLIQNLNVSNPFVSTFFGKMPVITET